MRLKKNHALLATLKAVNSIFSNVYFTKCYSFETIMFLS